MSRYEIVCPPMRDWPRLWRINMRRLTGRTFGPMWRQMNSLRLDPPIERP